MVSTDYLFNLNAPIFGFRLLSPPALFNLFFAHSFLPKGRINGDRIMGTSRKAVIFGDWDQESGETGGNDGSNPKEIFGG
jgi:hypothetical protein